MLRRRKGEARPTKSSSGTLVSGFCDDGVVVLRRSSSSGLHNFLCHSLGTHTPVLFCCLGLCVVSSQAYSVHVQLPFFVVHTRYAATSAAALMLLLLTTTTTKLMLSAAVTSRPDSKAAAVCVCLLLDYSPFDVCVFSPLVQRSQLAPPLSCMTSKNGTEALEQF